VFASRRWASVDIGAIETIRECADELDRFAAWIDAGDLE
jgi:hypothetical protein